MIKRIGEVAYKLDLPSSSRVHQVFHVSQLKPCLGPGQQVLPQLPSADDVFQVPIQVLQRRVCQQGLRSIVQGLVQCSGKPKSMATWEDLESLQQKFPQASAWGQADFQGRGNVNDPAPPASKNLEETLKGTPEAREARSRRQARQPDRFKDYQLGHLKPM